MKINPTFLPILKEMIKIGILCVDFLVGLLFLLSKDKKGWEWLMILIAAVATVLVYLWTNNTPVVLH